MASQIISTMYSIKEKLPEPYEPMLVFSEYDNGYYIAYSVPRNKELIWLEEFGEETRQLKGVVHWCELPNHGKPLAKNE